MARMGADGSRNCAERRCKSWRSLWVAVRPVVAGRSTRATPYGIHVWPANGSAGKAAPGLHALLTDRLVEDQNVHWRVVVFGFPEAEDPSARSSTTARGPAAASGALLSIHRLSHSEASTGQLRSDPLAVAFGTETSPRPHALHLDASQFPARPSDRRTQG